MTKVNDVFSGQARDLASDGRAIVAHPNGQTFFVDGLWLGERGQCKVTQLKGRFGFAQLISLEKPSALRQEAPCKHHGFKRDNCGGCPWQFVSYEAQLAAKQARVEKVIERMKGTIPVQPIWPSQKTEGYRNRAQLKSDGKRLGFVSPHSRDLVNINDCVILSDKNRQTLSDMRVSMPNKEWRISAGQLQKQQWTNLDIDESVSFNEVSINQRLPFRQANSEQNLRMKQWLSQILDTIVASRSSESKHVLELFCGAGNFTEIIASKDVDTITAVESVDSALQELDGKGLKNVKTLNVNLFLDNAFAKIYQQQRDVDILVLDPPRSGLKNKVNLLPKKSKIKHILYVSCDLATFARDVDYFIENKFVVAEVQPLDQFPHTPHVEIMAYLTRK